MHAFFMIKAFPVIVVIRTEKLIYHQTAHFNTTSLKWPSADYTLLMYKTAVYTLVNGAITHQKPQI